MKSPTETIINYILEKYRPEAVIIYGSFADGSANEHSDFDALVIAKGRKTHDVSVIDNTVLDVFVYPPETFEAPYSPADFVQIADGNILLDHFGAGGRLQASVQRYLDSIPGKTTEEIQGEIDWCKKMLGRTFRGDAEGFYRWHWLLADSLEIYFDVKHQRYCGPKKALRWLEQNDVEGFNIYVRALKEFSQPSLMEWVAYLEQVAS